MATPTFQKNGPNSPARNRQISPTRSKPPSLVFRQKASRPLLVNNVALNNGSSVGSSFRTSVAVTNPSAQYRLRLNTNPPSSAAPRLQASAVNSSQQPGLGLAQFFTFTGRYAGTSAGSQQYRSLVSDFNPQGVSYDAPEVIGPVNRATSTPGLNEQPNEVYETDPADDYEGQQVYEPDQFPPSEAQQTNGHCDGDRPGTAGGPKRTASAAYALHKQPSRPGSGGSVQSGQSQAAQASRDRQIGADRLVLANHRPPSSDGYRGVAVYSARNTISTRPLPITVGDTSSLVTQTSDANETKTEQPGNQSYLQRVNSANRAREAATKFEEFVSTGGSKNQQLNTDHNHNLKHTENQDHKKTFSGWLETQNEYIPPDAPKTPVIFKKNFTPTKPVQAVKPRKREEVKPLSQQYVPEEAMIAVEEQSESTEEKFRGRSVVARKSTIMKAPTVKQNSKSDLGSSKSAVTKRTTKNSNDGARSSTSPKGSSTSTRKLSPPKKSPSKRGQPSLAALEAMHVTTGRPPIGPANHVASSAVSNVATAPPRPDSVVRSTKGRSNSSTRAGGALSRANSFSKQSTYDSGYNPSMSSRSTPRDASVPAKSRETRDLPEPCNEDEEVDFPEQDLVDDEMTTFEDDDYVSRSGRSSVCSSMSQLSLHDGSEPAVTYNRTNSALATREDGLKPPLWPSLFSNIPPVIYFFTTNEKVAPLPHDIRKMLRWKPSSICPLVVKHMIIRIGFRWSKHKDNAGDGSSDWISYWGKHMKSDCFKTVREYQKVNHFPGSFQIGRKDRLFRNITRLSNRHGSKHFGFLPVTFVMPCDGKHFKRAWDEGGWKHKWILKPPASARGIGIRVVNKWNQIPKKRALIVQKYLARPFLINGSKFDMRIYCFVSSYDPLRVYVYEDGLVRFASMKYSNSVKSISNRFMHLTNYSINKKNDDYQDNSQSTKCEGHKWTLQALWSWMERRGMDHARIVTQIHDICIKTIIASEAAISSSTRANLKNPRSCYELFGFDIILDDHLKPYLLEVNISPSLHSNSELDVSVKEPMLRDLFNIVGFNLPDREEVSTTSMKTTSRVEMLKEMKIIRDAQLVQNERAKHAYYLQKYNDDSARSTILDILTADDIRNLTETEDELNRSGGYVRVFPNASTSHYLKMFDQPKYYNMLLDEWCKRHAFMPSRGIALLESLCAQRVHLNEREDLCRWSPTLGLSSFAAYPATHAALGPASVALSNMQRKAKAKTRKEEIKCDTSSSSLTRFRSSSGTW